MNSDTAEKLARSLTAETADLLPYLPYLLQDFWELGSSPRQMISLIKKHIPMTEQTRILDLACGKGAVSVKLAQALNVQVTGIDLTPEFIDYAQQKAQAWQVSTLCRFIVGDVNQAAKTEKNYDIVIFGAAGNVLGTPQETLVKLAGTIKPNGHILIDEAYLTDTVTNEAVKYKNYEYFTHEQWLNLFAATGLTVVEEASVNEDYDFDTDNQAIARRADELIARHPEKRLMFESFVQSQLNECADLENNIVGVTWLLQKQ